MSVILRLSMFILLSPTVFGYDLFNKFPQTRSFTTSKGQVVPLPFYHRKSDQVVLIGSGLTEIIDHQLSNLGYYSLRDSRTTSMVYLSFAHNPNTSMGAYLEMSLIVPASRHKLPRFISSFAMLPGFFPVSLVSTKWPAPPIKLFAFRIYTDSAIAFDLGREHWNLPKQLAAITRNEKNGVIQYSLYNSSGEQLSLSLDTLKGISLPLRFNEFELISHQITQPVRSLINGRLKIKTFNDNDDSFKYWKDSEIGGLLQTLNFSPKSWQIATDLDAVFDIP